MLKITRKPIVVFEDGTKIMETWLDWQKRSMSKAAEVIKQTQTSVLELLAQERLRWSEHVARMGLEGKPQHLLKAVLQHRPTS